MATPDITFLKIRVVIECNNQEPQIEPTRQLHRCSYLSEASVNFHLADIICILVQMQGVWDLA